MREPLYVMYRYGPLGVADVLYVKIHKGRKTTWIRDRDKASLFKHERAKAYARGYRGVGGDDLVIEAR